VLTVEEKLHWENNKFGEEDLAANSGFGI